jgi:adenosylmethionine-8-amino-7-oxononanoate aminotransferase
VTPDFLCLSKGLTAGYLPLAATLTTERVYEGFLGEHAEFKTFFHGHTYTGNPLACAAALASLDVFEREQTIERLQGKLDVLAGWLDRLVTPLPGVVEVRRRGFMVGIQLAAFPVEARMGHRVTLAARRRGAIIRPLGDVVVLMPPLAIGQSDLRRLVEITAAAIAEATDGCATAAVSEAPAASAAPAAGASPQGPSRARAA